LRKYISMAAFPALGMVGFLAAFWPRWAPAWGLVVLWSLLTLVLAWPVRWLVKKL